MINPDDGRHMYNLAQWKRRCLATKNDSRTRAIIPAELCDEIAEYCLNKFATTTTTT